MKRFSYQSSVGGFVVCQQFNNLVVAKLPKKTSRFSPFKVLVESAFYGNHVRSVQNIQDAYEMAKNAPGTVVADMPILHARFRIS